MHRRYLLILLIVLFNLSACDLVSNSARGHAAITSCMNELGYNFHFYETRNLEFNNTTKILKGEVCVMKHTGYPCGSPPSGGAWGQLELSLANGDFNLYGNRYKCDAANLDQQIDAINSISKYQKEHQKLF